MYSRPKLLDFPGFPAVLFDNRLIPSASHVRLLEWALALVARRKQPGLFVCFYGFSSIEPQDLIWHGLCACSISPGVIPSGPYRSQRCSAIGCEACNESFLRLGRQNEFGSASR